MTLKIKPKVSNSIAAEYMGIQPGTLEVWRSLGRGPKYYKFGSRVLYDIDDLDDYMKAHVVFTSDTAPELND